jgi:hypothetical protein
MEAVQVEIECAFCGRVNGLNRSLRRVYCEDCHAEHEVCPDCAAEVADGFEGLALVA